MNKVRQVPAFQVRGLLATLIGVAAAAAAWHVPELVPAVSFGLFAAAAFGVGEREPQVCDGTCNDGGDSAHTRAAGRAASPVADSEGNGQHPALRSTVIVINR
jgi:hypothetical protein